MKCRSSRKLLIGFLLVFSHLWFTSSALAEQGAGDIFRGDSEDQSINITVRRDSLPDRGIGEPVERPRDVSSGGGVVSDGPRVVWMSASDPDLGCRSGGVDVSRAVSLMGACGANRFACDVLVGGGSLSVGREVDSVTGAPVLGTERLSGCVSSSGGSGSGSVVVPVVSQEDFRSLGVEPLVAHLGPPGDWIPVGVDMVVWAESGVQVFDVVMLGQPVRVRATPVKFRWDFGDGTVLTTTFAGRPYPEKDVSMRYAFQGWYEVSLVTVFSGEFSVNGGEWQPIEGTVEVESERKWMYSDVRQSRLVGEGVPEEFVGNPVRGEGTLGPLNPEAKKETLTEPMKKR